MVLGRAYRGLTGGFLLFRNFSVAISMSPRVCFILVLMLISVPRRLFCFGSLVILDVARSYLWLFTLYTNIKIGKNSC